MGSTKKPRDEKLATRRARGRRQAASAKRKAYQRAYHKRHRERLNALARVYQAELRASPEGKAKSLSRGMLRRALAAAQAKKPPSPSAALLGYSPSELRAHIEAQFEPWMSWKNHGEWHVDHIKSIAVFIREGQTDPRIINALQNLRPVGCLANWSKGASV